MYKGHTQKLMLYSSVSGKSHAVALDHCFLVPRFVDSNFLWFLAVNFKNIYARTQVEHTMTQIKKSEGV